VGAWRCKAVCRIRLDNSKVMLRSRREIGKKAKLNDSSFHTMLTRKV
jgi:hypothetical protein